MDVMQHISRESALSVPDVGAVAMPGPYESLTDDEDDPEGPEEREAPPTAAELQAAPGTSEGASGELLIGTGGVQQ